MEQTKVNSNGAMALTRQRVPFVELVSPVRPIAGELAELATGAGSLAVRFYTAMRRKDAIKRTIRELQQLDDRILYDIGIERSQIVSVATAQAERRWPRR